MIRLPQFNGSALVARLLPGARRPETSGKPKAGWDLVTEAAFLLGLFFTALRHRKSG